MKDQSLMPELSGEDPVRLSRVRFKQQMFLGIGGATVFGLVGALGTALLDVLGAGISLLPVLGLGALAVVGIGCIYFGTKYWTESIRLDQDNQARKISQMTTLGRAPAPEIAKPQAPERPAAPVPGMGLQAISADEQREEQADRPGTRIHSAAALDKVLPDQGLTIH